MENILSVAVTIISSLIPAIWFLSTRIQRLQGLLEAHAAKIEEKIANLERQMADVSSQLAEARRETNELRERVVVVETRLSDKC